MIRIAREADIPAILEIYRPYVLDTTITFEYTVPTLQEFTERFRSITAQFPWLVWEEDGVVLGYVYASAPYARAAYAWCAEPSVYLTREARGRGIGKKLYAALEALLLRQGYQILYVLITDENEDSLAFHRKWGYIHRVQFPDCGFKFGRWVGVVWMEKRLKSVEIPTNMPTPWPIIMEDAQNISDYLCNLSLS